MSCLPFEDCLVMTAGVLVGGVFQSSGELEIGLDLEIYCPFFP